MARLLSLQRHWRGIELDLVDVAPSPIFTGLEAPDYRMVRVMKVGRGVLAR
jgi:hypothetical protein